MPQTKTRSKTAPKTIKKVVAPKQPEVPEEVAAESTEPAFPVPKKGKVEVEVEEETLAPIEKIEETSPFGEVPVEDESEDEAVLDDEELNPFGDKWEV